jgi:hypothetical protein
MACGICGLAVDTYCRAKASVFDHESGESGFGQSSRGMAVPGGRYLKVRIGGKPGPRLGRESRPTKSRALSVQHCQQLGASCPGTLKRVEQMISDLIRCVAF